MRRWTIALAASCAALVLAAVPALAAAPVLVSGPSPYAGCSNAGQPGTNYPNAEVEPWVSVNPANSQNIIGVFQQDRWSNGGAHGLVAGFSSNGGATWGESTLPFSACAPNAILDPFTGAPYNRASDPWVSIGPDGTAYAIGLLATNTTVPGAGVNDTGVATVTSSDGGKTWGNERLIKSDQGTTPFFEFTQFFNDKESVTADPVHGGTAYAVWDRLVSPSHTVGAALRANAFAGPTWFSKTTDGGKTWTGTRPIFDPGNKSQTIGNIVVVDPRNDAIYDVFEQFQSTGNPTAPPRGVSVGFVKSTDGGATWSGVTTISNQVLADDRDPNSGALLRTGNGLPSAAVDPATGQLYVAWTDARATGGTVNQAFISTSTNGGASWSAPARVTNTNTTPATMEFTVNVAVNSAGAVGATYYTMPGGAANTGLRARTSTNHGASFGAETTLAGPFNDLVAPNAGGFMLGDYSGLTANGTAFDPFFIQTNCTDLSCTANRTDAFFTSF